MRPVRLQIAGLRSWTTERELIFDNVDLAAVIGPTGAGKSSILEAIVYALYNSATYTKQPGTLISSDGKTMSVTLDFDADGERWRATRSISRGNYPPAVHKLACLSNPGDHPMVEGGGAVNAAIAELIGLSRDEFLAAVLLPQGKFQTLLMAQPALRAAILKGVFRLDELDEIRERASNLRRDQVEPTLEARREERFALLPDPAATWTAAKTEVKNCKGTVEKLEEIKGRYDGLLTQRAEQTRLAEAARLSAAAFEQGAKDVPALDEVVELEAGLSARRQEVEGLRRSQLKKRTGAQTQLDEAAKAGLTPESLAKAQHVLESATSALPILDDDTRVLAEAQREVAEQKGALASEESAHMEQAAKVAQSERAVAQLDSESDSADERRSNASEALHSLRTAADEVLEAQRKLVEQEEALRKSSTTLESAESELANGKAAVEGAEKVFETARAAHEAAHLAADLKPGELCPVCRQDLPAGFKPPKTPLPLQSAEKEVNRLRKGAEEAARVAAASAENVKTLTTQVKKLKTAARETESAETAAHKDAAKFLGTVDLSKDDTELLADLMEAATAAKKAHQQARDELLVVKGTLETAEKHLEERSHSLAKRTQELEQEAARIAREREIHSTALSELPAEFKPKSKKPEVLTEVASSCETRLGELQELQDSVRNAVDEIESLDEQISTLGSERVEQVDTPRREAAGRAQEIAAKLRGADSTAKVPNQPADNAELSQHIDWIQQVVAFALVKAEVLRAQAAEDEAAAAEAEEAADVVLKSAGELAKNELKTADEFARELDSWRA
jgi:DNA repair protein SbcC/Rad50